MKSKKMLYEAWIASNIRYGLEIYGFASGYPMDKLQKLQNKIVKLLFGRGDTKTKEIYNENKILTVLQMRDYMVITKNYYDNKFKNYNWEKINKLRTQTQRFELPRWKNMYGQRNKKWYVPNTFNRLPKNTLDYQSMKELKYNLKEIILNLK